MTDLLKIFYMINLRRLQALRVLRETGTVTSAAQAMFMTPSAVSQQLNALSRELGVDLLHHEGRRVLLTPAAHLLLEYGDEMAITWERCQAELAAHSHGAVGSLRVVAFESMFRPLLIPAAHRLQQSHPRLRLAFAELTVEEALLQLLAGKADIVILPVSGPGTPPVDDARYEQELLLADPQDLIVPVTHPLAPRTSVDLAETANDKWIATHPDQQALTYAACAAAGFKPRIVHEALEWNPVVALVEEGFGICLLPRLVRVGVDCKIRRIPLAGGHTTLVRQVTTYIRRGGRKSPAVAAFLDALSDIAQSLDLNAPADAQFP